MYQSTMLFKLYLIVAACTMETARRANSKKKLVKVILVILSNQSIIVGVKSIHQFPILKWQPV